jgi:glycosyltransferase involved in cell wall biosynthesis
MNIDRLPISVIVLTFNEERNIDACLKTIVDWAGEVWVVDSGSTDRTLEIVAQYTTRITSHPFDNYSKQRNWAQAGLALAHEWVFHIDADERVSPELLTSLRRFFAERQDQQVSGCLVRRRIEFMGRRIRHGGIYPTYHCRLFRRDKGQCEEREYDQHFLVEGKTTRLEADLIEVTASSLSSWTARHNRWAQLEAHYLFAQAENSPKNLVAARLDGTPVERRRWLKTSVYQRAPLFWRALVYFLVRYFLRLGLLDGIPGLIYHVLHGFWFRFYVDACYYELKHSRKKP